MHTAAIQFIPKARGRILHDQELRSAGYSKLSEKGVGSFRYLPIQSAINSCCCHGNLASTVNTAGLIPIIMVVGASIFSTVICLRRMLPLQVVESIYVDAMVTFLLTPVILAVVASTFSTCSCLRRMYLPT